MKITICNDLRFWFIFEIKLLILKLVKFLINFDENDSCAHKVLLSQYFKIILFDFFSRSTGEEIFAGLTEVALTALKEPLGPDRSALMEERLRTVGGTL